MRIGVCIIATGPQYHGYVDPLLASLERYFLTRHVVDIHLWTDSPHERRVKNRFPLIALEWPYPAVYRYHWILERLDCLLDYDYLFYIDADMRIVDTVDEAILSTGITAVEHPGFAFPETFRFPYDENPLSAAFVARQRYYASGFLGGSASEFARMARIIRDAVDADLRIGYIAIWHDESHYNRFLATEPPSLVLTPAYVYPEEVLVSYGDPVARAAWLSRWPHDYEPKILALKKPPRVPVTPAAVSEAQTRSWLGRVLELGLRRRGRTRSLRHG